VGVIFYVMLALRAELRSRGAFTGRKEPNLAEWLDIVALGTVADVVRLDANNRILVAQGLQRMRAGKTCAGMAALLEVAGKDARRVTAADLGFTVGPRINAAGRLEDMTVGIECLLADDPARAAELAAKLDRLNRERREIEADMQESALALLAEIDAGEDWSLCVHHPEWHPGVVGLLASRLKDRLHRPVFAFAADADGRLKGSGRSISGLHLRDALDLVSKRHPSLIERFGGHAAAAGLTLRPGQLEAFSEAFEAVAREWLDPAALDRQIEIDGELAELDISFDFAQMLRGIVWGQGFPEPRFTGRFAVQGSRIVGEKHSRLSLGAGGRRLNAIRFGDIGPFPSTIDAVFRLDINEFQGNQTLQLVVEHWSPAA
jgi:single-stranded-DNA-specific exonuclease